MTNFKRVYVFDAEDLQQFVNECIMALEPDITRGRFLSQVFRADECAKKFYKIRYVPEGTQIGMEAVDERQEVEGTSKGASDEGAA